MNYNRFINKDFRSFSEADKPRRHPALRWGLFAAGCAVITAVIANTRDNSSHEIVIDHSKEHKESLLPASPATQNTSIKLKLPLPSDRQTSDKATSSPDADTQRAERMVSADDAAWQTLEVKSGDSLSVLFDRAGVKPDQLLELMKISTAKQQLRRIHPGEQIKIMHDGQGKLLALDYPVSTESYLLVERRDDQLMADIHQHEIEVRSAYASGEIDSSLFMASSKAGLSHNLTMELANIFGWDIDFVMDIRKGDQFTVIYEQRYKNGNKIKDGKILAAEFINQGKVHRALRYVDPANDEAGYYTPSGHSMRKEFLRSPVNFSRISSRFSTGRYHPILHKIRSHKGVDYAASRGTPVRAAGDGKVAFKGNKGGYGKTIVLQHGSRYTTLYAHLNNYNKHIRAGGRIKQGQVIGYVGSSGLATGPHLHYEFRVNGVHRNPLTVKFPSSRPVAKAHRDNFQLSTQGYIAQLDVLSDNALALNDTQ